MVTIGSAPALLLEIMSSGRIGRRAVESDPSDLVVPNHHDRRSDVRQLGAGESPRRSSAGSTVVVPEINPAHRA